MSSFVKTNYCPCKQQVTLLLGIGVTFIMVGLIMVMVNRIITAREEEELAKYVSGRLARTRSGYHIGRDMENHLDQQSMIKNHTRSQSARLAPRSAALAASNHHISRSVRFLDLVCRPREYIVGCL